MKFPCYSSINLFLGLDRLLGFHLWVISLTGSGQALCYTAALASGLVLVTNTTKAYIHKLCVPQILKVDILPIFFFSE